MARDAGRRSWLNVEAPHSLRRLQWLAIFVPLVFLTALELLRDLVYPRLFQSWPGYLLLAAVVVTGTLVFTQSIFTVIARMQSRIARQNQELLSLAQASVAITGQLDLETVLQTVVEQARDLVGARYGALSLLSEEGWFEAFLTSGLTDEERARIGPIPVGRGLLGAVIQEARPIRTVDLSKEPGSVGFPPNHPPMRSLLAVPILSHGRVLGGLYLTEKLGGQEFDLGDEHRVERFATQAAIAIENARLHRRVQALAISEERDRIAREMHDSLAQVLGYVNTKAQAAEELLRRGEPDRAAAQIGQLAQAAREAYVDVRENILGLRASSDPSRPFLDTLREYLERWQDQSGVVATLEAPSIGDADLSLTPLAEIQLLRIIQEALANVRKHAGAGRAAVSIGLVPGAVEVTVSDDGAGFDPETLGRTAFPRFGLSTMRERAEAVGGTLRITARPGEGTSVLVRVPTTAAVITGNGGADARRDRR
ncbi:MAG TPA: GAF domain-containing protein [Thermomicrobiaceae bacterium]|nr:GAF domain-containing protein [Thermomicrobiaceae bacterium]